MGEKDSCERCGTGSDERALMEYKFQGEKKNICVRCLPQLIHGKG